MRPFRCISKKIKSCCRRSAAVVVAERVPFLSDQESVHEEMISNFAMSCSSMFDDLDKVHMQQQDEMIQEKHVINCFVFDLSGIFERVCALRAEVDRIASLHCDEDEDCFVSSVFPPMTTNNINQVVRFESLKATYEHSQVEKLALPSDQTHRIH